MLDFLQAFVDVFLYPIDPQNLNFENNPVMIALSAILIGVGLVRVFRDLYRGILK